MGRGRRAATGWSRSPVAGALLISLLVSAAAVLICPCPPPADVDAHDCCAETTPTIGPEDCCARSAEAGAVPPVLAARVAPPGATSALTVNASPLPLPVGGPPPLIAAASSFVAPPPPVLRV